MAETKAETRAVKIYWTGKRFGFARQPGAEAHIAIPVVEAREFLTKIVESEGADTFEDAANILIEVCDTARALLAVLPEEE